MGSGALSGGLSGRSVKFITHLHPRLRMRAAIRLIHSTPVWREKGLYNTKISEKSGLICAWPHYSLFLHERLTRTCQESVSRPRLELVTTHTCQKHQPLEPTSYREFRHDACLLAITRMINGWALFIWRALPHTLKRAGCDATLSVQCDDIAPYFLPP